MLPSKIEDFPILGGSKRPSKFHLFLHRFFIDFGSVLASNMGPSWGPRRLKIQCCGLLKVFRRSPRTLLDTSLLLERVPDSLGIDFGRGQGSIFQDFWMIFRASWLTLGMFSAALAGGTAHPISSPTLLATLSSFLAWSSAKLPKKSESLPRTTPRTNLYKRLQGTPDLKA